MLEAEGVDDDRGDGRFPKARRRHFVIARRIVDCSCPVGIFSSLFSGRERRLEEPASDPAIVLDELIHDRVLSAWYDDPHDRVLLSPG